MLREALRAPYRSDDAVGTLIVGGVLTLLALVFVPGWLLLVAIDPIVGVAVTPIALVPWFVLRGYYLRVVADGIEHATAAPSFVRWGELARTGIKSVLLTVVYLLPAGFLLGMATVTLLISAGQLSDSTPLEQFSAVGLSIAAGVDWSTIGTGIDWSAIEADIDWSAIDAALGESTVAIVLGVLGVASIAYVAVYLYVRPAAEAVLADTGRLRSAISPRPVGTAAIDGRFARAWLYSVLVGLFGGAIAIATIPALIGIFLLFSVRVSIAFLIGYGTAFTLGTPKAADSEPIDRVEPASRDDHVEARSDLPVASDEPVTVQVGRSVERTSEDRTSEDRPDESDSDPTDDAHEFEWPMADSGSDRPSDRY